MNSGWIERLGHAAGLLLLTACIAGCSISQQRLPADAIASSSSPADKEITIALLGATGMSGGYILREALARGYHVRALSRSADKLAYLGDRIEVVAGDARDPDTIAGLLAGSDIVISAIGPGSSGPDDLNSVTTANVIAAMTSPSIRPYIVVTGAAVALPGDQRDFTGWWVRRLALLRYPTLARDRQREYELLARSDIVWTLLRCPLIDSSAGEGTPSTSLLTSPGASVRAGELARFILDEVETGAYPRMAPFVASD